MIGSRLGPYQVLDKVGEGGMGQVYRAATRAAIASSPSKCCPTIGQAIPTPRQRFEREGRAVAAFSHPNVCAIFDVGHEGNVTYVVMEYVEGETLAARLERGTARPSSGSRIATNAAATPSATPTPSESASSHPGEAAGGRLISCTRSSVPYASFSFSPFVIGCSRLITSTCSSPGAIFCASLMPVSAEMFATSALSPM
jgi:serine/threonine protein kinase